MSLKLYCSLCLKPSKEYVTLQSCEGDNNDIYKNTVKYFDPMLLKADEETEKYSEKSLVLCQSCWMPIKDFHEFQQSVFRARSFSEKISVELEDQNQINAIIFSKNDDDRYTSADDGGKNYIYSKENNVYIKPDLDMEPDCVEQELISNVETMTCSLLEKTVIKVECDDQVDVTINHINANDNYKSSDDVGKNYVYSYENNGYFKPDLNLEADYKQQSTIDKEYDGDDKDDTSLIYLKNNTINKSKIFPMRKQEKLITTEECRKPKQINSEVITEHTTITTDQYYSQKLKVPLNNKKDKEKSALNRKTGSELDILISEWKPILECDLCEEASPSFYKLRDHFKEKHKTRFYIKCCERKFNHRYMLVNHIQLHLNPEAHKCDTCHKSFSSKSSMNRHLLTHITGEKNVACQECGKAYVHEDQLKLHIQSVHNASRTCDQCGKTFHSRYDLENHLKEHAGIEKIKFPCDECGAKLFSRSNLKRHKATVHHDGSTMYVCSICGKIAPNVEALLKHKINMHKKERKYKCLYCDKAFKHSKRLEEHTATHTGKDLYQCPHCPRKFKGKGHMHDHRKKYHPVEFEEGRKNRLQAPKVDINHVKFQIVL